MIQHQHIHYIQHVAFEGLGSIAAWADGNNISVSCTSLFRNESLPPLETYDWLVVMGGPMGVHDTETYPWLNAELHYIESAIAAGKTIVGVCLGAQMLAHVLGAGVRSNPHREIGWFPVMRAPTATEASIHAAFATEVTAFHWHGQTFDIPRGAVHLAGSEGCPNQAFIYEDRVLALQYHLETTPAAAEALIHHCGDEITEGPYIQTPETILSSPDRFTAINAHMARLLDHLSA